MAPHSSTLAWKIPCTEEPDRLQSMGSLRVGHDWATSLSLFTFMHWRRKWRPTPVFLPGESQGQGSLVGCRLWGRTESDTTEATQQQQQQQSLSMCVPMGIKNNFFKRNKLAEESTHCFQDSSSNYEFTSTCFQTILACWQKCSLEKRQWNSPTKMEGFPNQSM